MPFITSLLLGAFASYIGAWYLGFIEGNFALLLFTASVVTGIYWVAERFYFLPQRLSQAQEQKAQASARDTQLRALGITPQEVNTAAAQEQLTRQPWWLDWTAGLFPVILIVFLLRSFLFEPFKIPSGSMIPTLLVGDLILVNKFHYGVRLPVINTKVIDGSPVERGDVMVFRYPPKPSLDYIKRVIGVPGDEVSYLNKELAINGVHVDKRALPEFFEEDSLRYIKQYVEDLPTGHDQQVTTLKKTHPLLNEDDRPAFVAGASDFAFKDHCTYNMQGFVCKVPPGHYFMMGDNRDNSLDSRYWGFVPDENIVGKAIYVWMNFGNLKRIGSIN
jgi:signal peptidase I